jgi:hypothetical protein
MSTKLRRWKRGSWKDSPFREMRVEKKSTAFALKPLSTKTNCSYCNTGCANKQCKKSLCKKCCLADSLVEKAMYGPQEEAEAACCCCCCCPCCASDCLGICLAN